MASKVSDVASSTDPAALVADGEVYEDPQAAAEARRARRAERAARHSAEFVKLHQGTTVRSGIGIPLVERLQGIWDRRDVLVMLTARGLKAKYASSVLGYAWSFIEPAMLIVTYYLLLKIFHRSYPDYPLFVGSTVLAWQWFQSTVNSATTALRSNNKLITSVNLPREIYPLADIAQKAIEFVLSLPILLAVAWLYGVRPSGFLVVLPVALLLELMICVGMGLLISALNTVLRDIQRGVGIVMRMLFYSVPVLYPLAKLSPRIRHIVGFDPMTGILEMNRAVWFPAYWTGWAPVEYSVIGAVVILGGGILAFARLERTVLKEL